MGVPDTSTFSLNDVKTELGLGPTTDLSTCFNTSVDAYFDINYKGLKNSLYNFRNYQAASYTFPIVVDSCIWKGTFTTTHSIITNPTNWQLGDLIIGWVSGYDMILYKSSNTTYNFHYIISKTEIITFGNLVDNKVKGAYFYGIATGLGNDKLEFTTNASRTLRCQWFRIRNHGFMRNIIWGTSITDFEINTGTSNYLTHSAVPDAADDIYDNYQWLGMVAYNAALSDLTYNLEGTYNVSTWIQGDGNPVNPALSGLSNARFSFPSYGTRISAITYWTVPAEYYDTDKVSIIWRIRPGLYRPPNVSTNAVSSIHATKATFNGSVIHAGYEMDTSVAIILDRGFCWSTSNTNPMLSDSSISIGAGSAGNFSAEVSGLTYNDTYYVQAFAYTDISWGLGLSYGGVRTFDTSTWTTVPLVQLTKIFQISDDGADVSCNAVNELGPTILSRGACVSTKINPTTSDLSVTSGSGTGVYKVSFNNLLNADTSYYVRAWATNFVGTGYSDNSTFKTTNTGDYISASPDHLWFEADGTPISPYDYLYITSSGPWTAEIIYDDLSIIESFTDSSNGSSNAYVTVYYNDSWEMCQQAVIRFTCGTEYYDVSIYRDGMSSTCW